MKLTSNKFYLPIILIISLNIFLAPAFAQLMEAVTTPEPDTTPPGFISIAVSSTGEMGANIVWTTDELAYGYVEYGETLTYGFSSAKSSTASMDGNASLTNLKPGTNYHYRIVAQDESGNLGYSEDRTLETAIEVVAIDNVPPGISQISVSEITDSSVTISWTIDELAQGRIEYGLSEEYGLSTTMSTDYASGHSVKISGLQANREYHFKIVAQDESGNEAVSPNELFTTEDLYEPTPTPSVTASPTITPTPSPTVSVTPVPSLIVSSTPTQSPLPTPTIPNFSISRIETSSIDPYSATIVWSSSEPADSQVFYGTGESYASASLLLANKVKSHEVKITSLKPGTNYFYRVVSKNSSGVVATKEGFEFNTLFKQKVAVAPKISDVKVTLIGTSSATITFNTDVSAAGVVEYGTTTSYEKTDGGHESLLINHSHPISGLSPNTVYNFQIIVRDALGSQAVYKNEVFSTLAEVENIIVPKTTAVTPSTKNKSTPDGSSSGGKGGPVVHSVFKRPAITKVESLENQTLFVWQPVPAYLGFKTAIVRNSNGYAVAPALGDVLYEGNSGRFTDINLENGKKYYYSVFRINHNGIYSSPLNFEVIPKLGKTQSELISIPSIVQRTPIYKFSSSLGLGDKSKNVEHLQVLLASESSIHPKVSITGQFDALTERAVKNFQERYKLKVSGVADITTLRKLENFSSIEVANDRAKIYDAAFSRDLKIGFSGEDVSTLQQFLISQGVYPEALVTGYFGRLTRGALQRFQQGQNINPASGYLGQLTKKRILNLIRLRGVSF